MHTKKAVVELIPVLAVMELPKTLPGHIFHCIVIVTATLLSCNSSPSPSSRAATTTNSTDRLALLSFKASLSNSSEALASWNSTLPFCQWTGVTCSGGRVTRLALVSLGLTGPISPSLGNLTFLESLNLQDNNLHGPIPSELGRLSNLVNLTLKLNYLTGPIPGSLTRCSKLQFLHLRSNLLTGEIPWEIYQLSELKGINLYGNNITGAIPESIGNMSSLQYILFAENALEGSIPESIGRLTNLMAVQMAQNQFIGEIPASFFNLSSMYEIYLGFNHLNGSLPSTLFDTLPLLEHLVLNDNNLHGNIPASASNASYLVEIDLSSNEFSGIIPSRLGNSQYLWWVEIGMNQLEAREASDWAFLNSLTNCSDLATLDLQQNRLGGFLPSSLANLSPGITALIIAQNQIAGNLPSRIGDLVNLTSFQANDNLLTGALPDSIGNIRSLNVLSLKGNRLSGQIPDSMGNLYQLNRLHLQNNFFNGRIPSSLVGLANLQELDVSSNRLSGQIPKALLSLQSLSIRLDLSNNLLTGPLPREIGRLRNLNWLGAANNHLLGEIPDSIGDCLSLEYLYLRGNAFEGAIPQSMSSLQGLRELDLSSNSLSQKIPNFLGSIKGLQLLNLSFNEFEGQVPVNGVFKNSTAISLSGNSKLCGGDRILHLQLCDEQSSNSGGRKHLSTALKVIIAVASMVLCLGFALCVFAAFGRLKRLEKKFSFNPMEEQFRRASYGELLSATDGFAPSNLIGVGSFGSVYKGVMQPGDCTVAIKVLNLAQRGASNSFTAECEALRGIRHRNLVKILTACSSVDFQGNSFKALVLQYMPNGSLDRWLHPETSNCEPTPLSLMQRLKIAVDVASALDYLHNHGHVPVVHCDLKPSNVLLDEDMCGHLSDFGLAKILLDNDDKQTASTGVKGTIGYVPPEYGVGGEPSPRGDVYSYGILLLELLSGKRPTDETFKDGLSLREFIERSRSDHFMDVIDPSLIAETRNRIQSGSSGSLDELNCLTSVIKIGLLCSLDDSRQRMEAAEVTNELTSIVKRVERIMDDHNNN